MSQAEVEAIAALRAAVEAITRAVEASTKAQYGSEVLGPLDDALKDAQYALDVARGLT